MTASDPEDRSPPSLEGHIVRAGWHEDTLRIVVIAEDGPRALEPSGRFRWELSETCHCVGRFDGTRHVPCPRGEEVVVHPQCRACAAEDGIEAQDCIFEPRCQADPSTCTCTFAQAPHVVYCAFYGLLAKVGMTKQARVATRLREQGADGYFVIQECPDRATARQTERQVALLYDLPQFRTHKETLPQLARPVDRDAMARRAEAVRGRLQERYDADGPFVHIGSPSMPLPLPSPPRRVPAHGVLHGTWVGAKGPHLVFQRPVGESTLDVGQGGPYAALKLRALVGRRVRAW